MSNNLSALEKEILSEHFQNDDDYKKAVKRLSEGEPLAYIIGKWYFYDEEYKVSPHCLIPRPETEHLVDEIIRTAPKNAVIADLCTGSGCIAISSLKHRPDITAVAVDISENALEIAKENAKNNGVSERIEFICSDVLNNDPLKNTKFDIIVSNPPYIVRDVIPTLSQQVKHEPIIALDGGEDGLDFYRRIFEFYVSHVKPGGKIICEIGYDQGEILKKKYDCTIIKDYSSNDRVAILSL